jgi:hypothetical protein
MEVEMAAGHFGFFHERRAPYGRPTLHSKPETRNLKLRQLTAAFPTSIAFFRASSRISTGGG